MHQRTSSEGPNSDKIKFRYVRGSLRPDQGSAGGAEDQIYMAALNSTVAPVLPREYVRTGKRGEGRVGAGSKVLDAYGRFVLNENGKLLLGFAEDNKLPPLNTFFCTPKNGVPYIFQSANRGKRQARLDYILTKQADRRLIRCVNVRRPPLVSPESDPNVVYVKVRIPCSPHQTGDGGTVPSKLLRRSNSGDS